MNIKQFYLPMRQTIITIIICLAILAGVNLVYAWTGPTQAPPDGNVPAPINVGSSSQYKSGALGIGGLLQAPQIQLTTGAGAGKVLTSNASGLASWQTGGASGVSQIIAGTNITISPTTGTGAVTINSTGGASGYWALSGANIYNTNTGNVGIGTTNPPWTKVQIYDGTRYFNIGSYNATEGALSGFQVSAIGGATGGLGTYYAHNYTTGNTQIASTGGFDLYVNGASSKIRILSINPSGNVGIGTASPGEKLEV